MCGPSKCGKGFKHVAKSGDTASSCTPCAVETFNAADDTSSTCAAWKTSCSNGILTEGDLTKDHVCVSSPLTGCKINEFWTAAASSTVAAYCTRCPAGKYLEHSGTGVHTTTTCTAHGTCHGRCAQGQRPGVWTTRRGRCRRQTRRLSPPVSLIQCMELLFS